MTSLNISNIFLELVGLDISTLHMGNGKDKSRAARIPWSPADINQSVFNHYPINDPERIRTSSLALLVVHYTVVLNNRQANGNP